MSKTNSRVCTICGQSPAWNYYSVMCCDPCRFFFKNNSEKWAEKVKEGSSCGGNCPVTREDRKCKYCRIVKCFNMGMSQSKGRNANNAKDGNSSAKSKTPARRTKLSLKGSKKCVTTLNDWATKDKPQQSEMSVTMDTADVTNDETTEDLEDDSKVPCVAALHNLGNTCFLNSVVQVLRYTPKFEDRIAVLAKEIKKTERERAQLAQLKQGMGDCGSSTEDDEEILTWVLVRNLHSVFRKMALAEEKFMSGQSNFIAIRPYDLLDTVERLNPMFQGNLQQDAHEFLRCLLAYIQDASRELNKYRKRTAESLGCSTEAGRSAADNGPLPLLVQPKEVELLGGCNDENKVSETSGGQTTPGIVTAATTTKSTKIRTSQRLSGGKGRSENVEDGAEDGVQCKLVKAAGKKRRSLTELQNQDYSGLSGCQMTILGSLIQNEPVGIGQSGDRDAEKAGVNGCSREEEGERRMSGKRKVVDDDDTLVCEVYREGSNARQLESGDATFDNVGRKRPRRSQDSATGENDDNKVALDMECEEVDNDNEQKDTKEQEVVAKVKPRLSLERKQTARKTMGGNNKVEPGYHGDEDVDDQSKMADEIQKEEVAKKQPIVKLDKNGITKYFAKVSKPQSLADIERHTEPVKDLIEDLFQGQVALQTRCCECETVTERREAYQDISVAVRQRDDADEEDETTATAATTDAKPEQPEQGGAGSKPSGSDPFEWVRKSLGEVERLMDDNKYVCDRCCHLVEAERSMHYTSVPGVLTLHLKRFAMLHGLAGGFTKLTDHVPLPMVLPCIEDDCTDPDKHRLELYGVVTHTGFTLSCGHYTAYVRADPLSPAIMDYGIDQQTQPVSSNHGDSATTSNDPEADPNNNQDSNNNVESPNNEDSVCPTVSSCTPSSSPSYWFECDDNIMTILTEEAFLSRVAPGHSNTNTPYLLFYQRVHIQ